MIYLARAQLKEYGSLVTDIFVTCKEKLESNDLWTIVIFVLMLFSFVYLFYGLQNSFIPYSTARDANHEYMYTPKILAENAGVYR